MSLWLVLAVAMAVAHGLLAVFLIVGLPPAVRRPRLMRWYLAALVPTAAVNLTGQPCPLTVWEKDLWRLAGETPYQGGFISHYFVEPFRSGGLTPTGENILLISVTAWCLSWLLYSAVWHLRLKPRPDPVPNSESRPMLDANARA